MDKIEALVSPEQKQKPITFTRAAVAGLSPGPPVSVALQPKRFQATLGVGLRCSWRQCNRIDVEC